MRRTEATTIQGMVRKFRLLFWLLLVMLMVGLGSYLIFGMVRHEPPSRRLETSIIATADLSTIQPPLDPYPGVDPLVLTALLFTNPYGDPGVNVLGVPPLGSYLPAVRELPEATPPPTLLPGIADASGLIAPAEILEYGGDGCAPDGMPVLGILTQRYHAYHSGIDLGVPSGTPVLATHSGKVLFAGWSSIGYGYLVIIQNDIFITYYAHLSNFNVVAGQEVGLGSVIAWSGSTGNSSGPHVHYETRVNDSPLDPGTFNQRGYKNC